MDKPEPLSDDTLKRAAELLRTHAHELRVSHSRIVGGVEDWYGEDDARELYEETLRVADGLDRYEARIAEAERSRDELVQKMHQLERERDALRVDAQDWMLIEEDAAVDAPLDTPVLLAWWDDWSAEWKIEVNFAGSERGGWRHGRATHWKPQPKPPTSRAAQEKPKC